MAYVYILQCADGSYYTGATTDLKRRFNEHTTGKAAKYTRGRRPLVLSYFEYHENLNNAYKREKQIQKYTRIQKEKIVAKKKYLQ